jgi:hypothetical protein
MTMRETRIRRNARSRAEAVDRLVAAAGKWPLGEITSLQAAGVVALLFPEPDDPREANPGAMGRADGHRGVAS